MNEAEMQKASTWEDEGELHRGRRGGAGVVQSVRFTRGEIARVRDAASHAGVTTSEFIRHAAIERASPQSSSFVVTGGAVGEVFRVAGTGTENGGRGVDLVRVGA